MKIITHQLEIKLPTQHWLLTNEKINPTNISQIIQKLQGKKKLEIFDLTSSNKHPNHAMLNVKDHINRTGINPLRKKQKNLTIDFLDITKLYKEKKESIITDCCGKNLNNIFTYPSHYLCNISILAKHLGIDDISAFLINIV